MIMLMTLMWIACGAEPEDSEPPVDFSVAVPAVLDDGTIPVELTCDGADTSPEVRWEGLPEGTVDLLLAVDDPDAPGTVFNHWRAWGLPSDGIDEGASGTGLFTEGTNGFGELGWGGPCPPQGQTHTYVFKLTALSAELELDEGASRVDVAAATEGLVIEEVQTTGTYSRVPEDTGAD